MDRDAGLLGYVVLSAVFTAVAYLWPGEIGEGLREYMASPLLLIDSDLFNRITSFTPS